MLFMLGCQSSYDSYLMSLFYIRGRMFPRGGSIVKPRKSRVPKTPLASLFYRGRMVISAFLYLPELVWRIRDHICDQREKSSGIVCSEKFQGTPNEKMKFPRLDERGHEPVGSATPTRRAVPSLISISALTSWSRPPIKGTYVISLFSYFYLELFFQLIP